MGQGQEKPAEALVQRFAKDGGWILLQNLHLMQDWVPALERLLEDDLKEAKAARHGEPLLEVNVCGPIKGGAGGPSTYQGPR